MPGKGAGRPVRNPCVEWGGRKYTWSKGFWRCTSYHDRHNLTHLIWLATTGKRVPPGHSVIFLDGNFMNIDPNNLLCVTPQEAQKIRQADPDTRALSSAYLAYGLLVQGINEANDPEKMRERVRSAWSTRRERYGAIGRKNQEVNRTYSSEVAKAAAQKANRTKLERYGNFGKTWETRRERMGMER